MNNTMFTTVGQRGTNNEEDINMKLKQYENEGRILRGKLNEEEMKMTNESQEILEEIETLELLREKYKEELYDVQFEEGHSKNYYRLDSLINSLSRGIMDLDYIWTNLQKEEIKEEKNMNAMKTKEVMEKRMDDKVFNYLAKGNTLEETIAMVYRGIESAERSATSEDEAHAQRAMFAGARLMGYWAPALEAKLESRGEEVVMEEEAQERFDKMSEKLDDIKETMREHSQKVKEEKANFEQKVRDAGEGKSVASETDKVMEKAEEVFTQSSKVVKSATKKTVKAAKKAERKFGRFMGEFLAKSAMEGAVKNRQ